MSSGVNIADPVTSDRGLVRSFSSVSRQRQAEAAAASSQAAAVVKGHPMPAGGAGAVEELERAPELSGELEELRQTDDSWLVPEETQEERERRLIAEEFRGPGNCNVIKWTADLANLPGELNEIQMELSSAKDRRKRLVDDGYRRYGAAQAQHGEAMEKSKPYFVATKALTAASQRVQDVVSEFTAAASQHEQAKKEHKELEERLEGWSHQQASLTREQKERFSRVTEQVIKCQEERDKKEMEYAHALQEYNEAQRTAENWQQHIGHSTIRAVQPAWRCIQTGEAAIKDEEEAIVALEAKVLLCKKAYNTAMKEVEKISNQVHSAWEAHFQAKRAAEAAAHETVATESPETTHPASEGDMSGQVNTGKLSPQRDGIAL